MRIVRVEVTPFSLPRREPISFATGSLQSADHVLVTVGLEDGTRGHAEAIPRPMIYGETTSSIVAALRDLLVPPALGADASRPDELLHRFRLVVGNHTARSALELAVLDAWGRALGVPCHRMLGGYTDRVACTALLGWGDPEKVAGEAVAAREALGVDAFKLKVGIDLELDVATTWRVREAVGEGALVYADANHGFSPYEAGRYLERTREVGLALIEEPFDATLHLARRDLARRSPVAVMGDESCVDVPTVTAALLDGTATMVSLKPARTGARGSLRIRDLCEALGAGVVVGSQGESGIGTYAAAAVAAAGAWTTQLPAELLYHLDLAEDLVEELPRVHDGHLQLPDTPGFGFAVDEDRLRHRATAAPMVLEVS